MRNTTFIVKVAALIILTGCVNHAIGQRRSEDLLLPTRLSAQVESITRESFIVRSRTVILNSRVIRGLSNRRRATINLNLFADAKFVGRVEQVERPYEDSRAWSGRLVGRPGTFTFVIHNNVVMVTVRTSSSSYQVRPAGTEVYSAVQIDQSKFKECGVGVGPDFGHKLTVTSRVEGPQEIENLRDTGSEITVLTVYTPAARDRAAIEAGHAAGTTTDIEALIDTCITETNDAYRLSGITPRLKLVYRGLESYQGDQGRGASVYTVLPLFRGKNDGVMDDVHGRRDNVKADVCVLLMVASDAGGLASMMNQYTFNSAFESQAFAVVDLDSASGNLNYGHEIGHIQGNCHDRPNCRDDFGRLDQGEFPYSYGYRYTTGGQLFHTIMAYRPGALTLHFSNPDIKDNGVPTGVPESEAEPCNEAKTINQTAAVVANFRINNQ